MWLKKGILAGCSLLLAKSWLEPLSTYVLLEHTEWRFAVLWLAGAALDLQLHKSSQIHLEAALLLM